MTMPNFFVVGAQKGGTTSLYYYLKQHPQVYLSPRKEPHFFEGMRSEYSRPERRNPPITNIEDYQALFDGVVNEKAIGEASASYLYSPRAPILIKQSVPDAKVIVLLRNPSDRAYSNFLHCVRTGREPLDDFGPALRAEDERVRASWAPLWHYKRKGFYYGQVKRYFEEFGRGRVGIWLSEDLRADPLEMLRGVYEFLGVDEAFAPNLAIEHNTSGLPKNKTLYVAAKRLAARNPTLKLALLERLLPAGPRRYVKDRIFVKPPPFPEEIRRGLIEDYREDILMLQELIGRDLSPWLEGKRTNVAANG